MLTSWMNNWDYAASIPTGDFRGSMTLPREYALREVDGEVRVVQTPVAELQELRREHFAAENVELTEGALKAPLSGKALEIVAVFDAAAASAEEFGVKLRVGAGEETLVGYDVAAGEAFVDRTNSGFLPSEAFAARHGAPLEVMEDGTVKLHIFLDSASVELFANDGLRTVTDQIFPDAESLGLQLYAKGGEVDLVDFDVWRLSPDEGVAKPPKCYRGTAGDDLLVPQSGAKSGLKFFGFGGDDQIQGSGHSDLIQGGDGDDRIGGGAGADRLWGGAGRDVFWWGDETRDGRKETTTVRDFQRGQDRIDLGEAEIARVWSKGGSTVLTLDGDGDRILLHGTQGWSEAWLA